MSSDRVLLIFLSDDAAVLQGPISNPSVRGKAIFNRGVVEVPSILNRQLQVCAHEEEMPYIFFIYTF